MKCLLTTIPIALFIQISYSQNTTSSPWQEHAIQELQAGNVVETFALYAREIELNWYAPVPTPPNSLLEHVGLKFEASKLTSTLCLNALKTKFNLEIPSPTPFIELGNSYSKLGEMELALVNFDKALEMARRVFGDKEDKRFCDIYFNCAKAYDENFMHREALILYEKTIKLNPDYPNAKNFCARLLSTSHDSTLHDVNRALELARLECTKSQWRNPAFLDTYAAAQAANRNFTEAIKWQLVAIKNADEGELAEALEQRLQLYQRRTPYRIKLAKPVSKSIKDAGNIRQIERFVKRYSQATQKHSWDTLNTMIHPDSLTAMKEEFLSALLLAVEDKGAVSRDELQRILTPFRVKSIPEFKLLTGKEFTKSINRAIHGKYFTQSELTPRNLAKIEIASISVSKDDGITIAIVKHVASWKDKKIEWYSTIFLTQISESMKVLSALHTSKNLPDLVSDQIKELKEGIDQAYYDELRGNDGALTNLIYHFIFRHFDLNQTDIVNYKNFFQKIGTQVHPIVLEILKDPKNYKDIVKQDFPLRQQFPFNRACMLLGDAPPEAAVPAVAPFLNHPDVKIQRDAASIIGKVGQLSCIPHLRTIFKHSDYNLRYYTLIAVLQALNRNELPATYSSELFPDVKRLLEKNKHSLYAVEILHKLDPDKAKKFFLSPTFFFPDSKDLIAVLEIYANENILVPREKLLPLIDALNSAKRESMRTFLLKRVLHALAQHREPEDWPRLEKMMSHPEDAIAIAAAKGLLISKGFGNIMKRLEETEKKFGYNSLSDHQRYYISVARSDTMSEFLGLWRYLNPIIFNSINNPSADDWKDALTGYKAMGFTSKFEALRDALSLFGSNGPSENSEIRKRQFKNLSKKNKDALKAAGKRYRDSPELFDVIAAKFVLANPESFQ
ncbi:MAG: DUF4375 domain-containing protein [Verrucomicrobiales bacterium]|nr:DUF4375 domain-containing protein [Verrucomicrobiales bacterium]